MGIIAILVAITIPVVGKIRESARKTKSITNVRQLGVAVTLYAGENNGCLPPFQIGDLLWSHYIVSYLNPTLDVGQNSVFFLRVGGSNAINDAGVRQMGLNSVLSDPAAVYTYSDPPLVTTSYAINPYLYNPPGLYGDANIDGSRQPVLATADRPASTVLFTQAKVSNYGSYHAASGAAKAANFSATPELFSGGMLIVWIDGHVTLEKKTDMVGATYGQGGANDRWSLQR